MSPGRSEFISSGKFSVGYYWGWYVLEWAELPIPTAVNPEEKIWTWVRLEDWRNPAPFYGAPLRGAELDEHNRVSNLAVRNLFRQLTGIEICKWDMYHSEEA